MATRYIYLSDELNNKLKQEDNVSALIVRLLNDHYSQSEIYTANLDQLKHNILTEKETFDKNFKNNLERIESQQKKKQEAEEEERQRAEKAEKRQKDIRNNLKTFCKDEIGRELTEEEIDEYLEQRGEKEALNIWHFSQKIKEREDALKEHTKKQE